MAFEFIYLNNTLIFFFSFSSFAMVFSFVVRVFAVMKRSFRCSLDFMRCNVGAVYERSVKISERYNTIFLTQFVEA